MMFMRFIHLLMCLRSKNAISKFLRRQMANSKKKASRICKWLKQEGPGCKAGLKELEVILDVSFWFFVVAWAEGE